MHGKNTQKPSCGNGFRQGHSASIEISLQRQKEKHLPKQVLFFLVEAGGVEPPSENASTGTSPGADGHLHSRTLT